MAPASIGLASGLKARNENQKMPRADILEQRTSKCIINSRVHYLVRYITSRVVPEESCASETRAVRAVVGDSEMVSESLFYAFGTFDAKSGRLAS